MTTSLGTDLRPEPRNTGFVPGHSPAIKKLNAIVEEIARTNIPVLLMGESGTGKDVYGRVIHLLSRHKAAPLKKVNRDLFPDGETEEKNPGGFRIISSTLCNLEKEVEFGRFRTELYFRINGVCLRLPPLRDRKEDIFPLMEHFLAKHAEELGRQAPFLSDEEKEFLETHDWPGNVRELENLARRIVLLGDSRRAMDELRELPALVRTDAKQLRGIPLKVAARTASRRAERDLIAKALERTHWNRKRAARELQISYKSLLYKIKQTGLEEAAGTGGKGRQ